MPQKKTRYWLNKLVDKLGTYGYDVRFEKGNFRSGYCILENRKVVVVNKFHDVGSRIDTLRMILAEVKERSAAKAAEA